MSTYQVPGGTAAYIVACDLNENPKSDFDFDLGFVNNNNDNLLYENSSI